ncbi:MAG: hypothetical protein ACPL4I_11325 [Bacteroidota bacterium]
MPQAVNHYPALRKILTGQAKYTSQFSELTARKLSALSRSGYMVASANLHDYGTDMRVRVAGCFRRTCRGHSFNIYSGPGGVSVSSSSCDYDSAHNALIEFEQYTLCVGGVELVQTNRLPGKVVIERMLPYGMFADFVKKFAGSGRWLSPYYMEVYDLNIGYSVSRFALKHEVSGEVNVPGWGTVGYTGMSPTDDPLLAFYLPIRPFYIEVEHNGNKSYIEFRNDVFVVVNLFTSWINALHALQTHITKSALRS